MALPELVGSDLRQQSHPLDTCSAVGFREYFKRDILICALAKKIHISW